jgi:fumarate reductase subunit D
MKKVIALLVYSFLVPVAVYAQDFETFMGTLQSVIAGAVPIIISFGVVVLLWGIVKYIRAADQPQKREEGRQLIVYGIISVFVMVSMWGLINLIVSTVLGGDPLFLNSATDVEIPDNF